MISHKIKSIRNVVAFLDWFADELARTKYGSFHIVKTRKDGMWRFNMSNAKWGPVAEAATLPQCLVSAANWYLDNRKRKNDKEWTM